MTDLFSAFNFKTLHLNNRIVMAPMTRSRTDAGDVPSDIMVTYYQQRATAGLIISEGTPISPVGRGYSLTPGIYTQAHIDGWKKVTEAVHKEGGKIFVQLWHVGRRSHDSITGEQIVSSSANKEADKVFGPLPEGGFGMIETSTPRALSVEEIQQTVQNFVQAAKNAMEAGFDGVEVHGAHGYLLDQFMRKPINQRHDNYGGSIENRLRFTLEVMQSIAAEIGGDKTAIRLSPHVMEGTMLDDDEIIELTYQLLEKLAPLELAYVHFSENISNYTEVPDSFRQKVREIYPNPVMVAGKQTLETANALLAKNYVDLVAFGQPFITNPDFVYRVKNGVELTPVGYDEHATFYGGDGKGLIDYPIVDPDLKHLEVAK